MTNILISIVDIAGKVYIALILLRFLLQMARADFYNPISQFIVKVTHPLLKPLRKIIPSVGRQDFASIVLAYLVQLVVLFIKILLIIMATPIALQIPYAQIPLLALVELISLVFYILYLLFIGSVILSWIAPDSRAPAAMLINQVCNFILAPLRRIIPPIGIFDITPMVAFLILILINSFIIRALYSYLGLGIG